MLLQRKVVVISSVGGGLGESLARVCHGEGASVVAADIRGAAAASVAASLRERALAVTCAGRGESDPRRLVEAAERGFGRIEGLTSRRNARR